MNQKPREIYIFEDAPVPAAVTSLAVPTVITQLINIVYNFADTYFVGRTGDAASMAAMSVVMPIYVIMAAIANLFGVGGSSIISRYLGMKKEEDAKHVFAFSFYGGIVAAVVYMIIVAAFRPQIIMLCGGDANSYDYIYSYLTWTTIVGAIPTVGNVLCGHLVRSVGASKQAGFGMSMGGLLNCILDPLFMFVILPAGHEVEGAAIATCLSNTAAFVYFIVFLYMKRKTQRVFSLNVRDISFQDRIPAEVLLIGIPAMLQTTLAMVSNIAANALVTRYGTAAVAGMGVAKKINMLAFNTTMGLTMGVLPLIGYNYGAKNYERLKDTIRFTAITGLVFDCACMVLFRISASSLTRFFIDESESVYYGTMFLRVIAFAAPLACLTYLSNSVFQATGRKTYSFLLSILRKGLLDIPAMFVFRHYFGIIGVVAATPFAEVISAVLAIVLLFRLLKTLKKEMDHPIAKDGATI